MSILDEMKKEERVCIFSEPTFDSVCSGLAFGAELEKSGVEVTYFCPMIKDVADKLSWVPWIEKISEDPSEGVSIGFGPEISAQFRVYDPEDSSVAETVTNMIDEPDPLQAVLLLAGILSQGRNPPGFLGALVRNLETKTPIKITEINLLLDAARSKGIW